jgi:hypothetical protein
MIRCLPLCLLLLACDSPGRGFGGIEPVSVIRDGAHFAIRRRGDVAEAIRTNALTLPRFDWVAVRGKDATEEATGCTVAWVVGDPSVLLLGLACEGRAAPALPRGRSRLWCEAEAGGLVCGH